MKLLLIFEGFPTTIYYIKNIGVMIIIANWERFQFLKIQIFFETIINERNPQVIQFSAIFMLHFTHVNLLRGCMNTTIFPLGSCHFPGAAVGKVCSALQNDRTAAWKRRPSKINQVIQKLKPVLDLTLFFYFYSSKY